MAQTDAPPNPQDTTRDSSIRFLPCPANAPPVVICLPDGTEYQIRIDTSFDQIAERMIDQVRNRRQWRKVASTRDFIFDLAGSYFGDFGPDKQNELQRVAKAGVVEVRIPAGTGESAFAFPWEFALSEITNSARNGESLLIVRHLDCGPAPAFTYPANGIPVWVIMSAPGKLGDAYSFDSEYKLINSSFGEMIAVSISDPSIDFLRTQISAPAPAVSPGTVHFAGIDGYQGGALLRLPRESWGPGMFLSNGPGNAILVPPDAIAAAAASAPVNKPLLVSYNFYNSSWPLASVTVRNGAQAAIGFQDTIDDAVAELFFARLYEAWQRLNWNLLLAYKEAWKGLSVFYTGKLRGTGIVLWSRVSLLPSAQISTTTASSQTTTAPESILQPDDPRFQDVSNALSVEIEECKDLNYSMLHNNQPLFEKFKVLRQVSGRLLNITVQVELNTGTEVATYSTAFDLSRTNPSVNVAELARVSLTSSLTRSLRESVYTSLSASVFWADRLVRSQTFRVALLPPDEWRDDATNRVWLPSFVLPRDPVVARAVDRSQGYLCALADDGAAGFDGYQGVSANPDDEDRCASVDKQVQAFWWMLIQEYSLSYINPPPSFRKSSQRLRTPSDVLEGRRGTCIDLTLLLAALLEYVDIYPVIFLLEGHAFPGYVRSEESYAALRNVFLQPCASPDEDKSVQRDWILSRCYYTQVLDLVRQGDLIPIESVALTQRAGFWNAVDQGVENLRSKADFEYLFDIKAARQARVTPIPLWRLNE